MEENPTPPPYEAPSAPVADSRADDDTPMFASTSAPVPSDEDSGSPIAISFLSRVRPSFWDD